jgi:hypothetical protein
MTNSAKAKNNASTLAGCLKMSVWACIGLTGLAAIGAILPSNRTSPTPESTANKQAAAGAKAQPAATSMATRLGVTNTPEAIPQIAEASEITTTPPPTGTPEPPGPTDTPEPTSAPEPTQTPEDPLQAIARRQCQDRLRTAQLIDGVFLVTCKLQENFTQSWMVGGAVDDHINIAKAAFAVPDVRIVTVQIIGDFKDEYGNPSEPPAFTFKMSRQLFAKINWANTFGKDVAQLMDKKRDGSSVGVAPAWRESWRDYLQ